MTQQIITLTIDILAASLTLLVILQLLAERYLPIIRKKIADTRHSYLIRNEMRTIMRRQNCQY